MVTTIVYKVSLPDGSFLGTDGTFENATEYRTASAAEKAAKSAENGPGKVRKYVKTAFYCEAVYEPDN